MDLRLRFFLLLKNSNNSNELIDDDASIAQIFNDYFVNIASYLGLDWESFITFFIVGGKFKVKGSQNKRLGERGIETSRDFLQTPQFFAV